MTMLKGRRLAAVWIMCGVLNWGITLGYFCGEYPKWPHRDHYGIAAFVALAGPIGTLVSTFASNFWQHGLVWK